MRKTSPGAAKVIPMRFKQDLLEKLAAAAEALGLPQQDVARMSMAVGLEHLRRIDYDLTKLIVETIERQPSALPPISLNEDTPDYRVKRKKE